MTSDSETITGSVDETSTKLKVEGATTDTGVIMLEDNGGLFLGLLNKNAFFARAVFGGKKYYIAVNRAARRFLKSSKAKSLGLTINLEDNTIS